MSSCRPIAVLLGCALLWSALAGCKDKRKISAFPDSYSGVGMELEMRDGMPFVVRPIGGGPAAAAGVLAGEKLVAVDGESTEGMTLAQVVERVRGPKGSAVRLTLEMRGKQRTLPVRRGKLERTDTTERSGSAYKAGGGGS